MKDTDYAGTNARIRVFETRLLKKEQFDTMLQAKDFDEAVNVLKDSPYRQDVERMKETKEYDVLLDNEMQRTFQELFDLTPEPRLIELFSLRYTYHNLKVLLKAKLVGENFDFLLIDIGREPLSALRNAVETGKSELLDPMILAAIADTKAYYEEYQAIQAVDILLDRAYFHHLKAIAVALKVPRIIECIELFIDLSNLSTLSRAVNQKQTQNFLRTILSSAGKIPKEQLLALITEDLTSLPKKLSSFPYESIIETATNPETGRLSPVALDLATDNALMAFFQEAKFDIFGPMPMLAYLYAKETEIKNLRLLLVGKNNQLSQTALEERMRINYGS
ncbi:V-type ATPase subunit [Carnobacterium gallinarum]|uniref:V-type ATPase subunit n=1 Tax=Carnobacterium gallinarum TaxID=2749 RepID=UPI0005525041|nr:V-type ATPase subunit [Carnobacterium gallinarum]